MGPCYINIVRKRVERSCTNGRNMKLLLLCLFAAAVSCKMTQIRFKSCLTAGDKAKALQIKGAFMEPCDKFPCPLIRGQTSTLTIKFTATQDEADLQDVCHGKIVFWLPFPLPFNDQCKRSGICPLKAGNEYTYSYSIPVKKVYPQIKVPVKWELQRKDGSKALCIEFPSYLV